MTKVYRATHSHELTHDLRVSARALGPCPYECLDAFVDLGLSDSEIARYFHLPSTRVEELRMVWGITR